MAALTIPSIFTAIDKMSAPVKKMGRNMDDFALKTETAAARIERSLRKTRDITKDIATKSAMAGAAILAPLAIATKQAMDFESSMGNISTIVDTSKESMKDMGQEVLQLSTKMPVALEDLTGALYDIRSAGITAEKSMGALETSGKLATAGLSTTKEATNLLTSGMNAFASEGLESAQIADLFFKTVKAGKTTVSELSQSFGATAGTIQSAGVKLADFQAATAALTTVGVPASQAQTQLRAAIVAMQKPTAEMQKIFKKLGVTSEKELIEKSGGMVGAFDSIGKAGAKMGINMAKAWSSTEAAGAVVSLTGATNEAYLSTLEDMTKGVGALDVAFKKQLETGAAQSKLAENNMKALSITIGTELIPIVISLLKRVTPIIQKFMSWAKENPKLMKGIVLATAAIGAFAIGVSVVSAGISFFSSLLLVAKSGIAIATAAQWLFNAAMSANPIGLVVIAIAAMIAVIVAVVKYWNEWGAALSLALGPLGMIISLVQSFRRNWGMITAAFKNDGMIAGFKAIGKTILDAILMPLQQIMDIIQKVSGFDWAKSASESIGKLRADMGVNVDTDESGNPLAARPAISSKEQEWTMVKEMRSIQEQRATLEIKDETGRASLKKQSNFMPVKISSTMAFQ
jgi:TP901 family phage tail tape measure protein